MAHEYLIVIGFGVALAVVSVSLFLSHVKRISAPNKADPAGTLVSIDLAAALAEDQITAQRKATAKRSKASNRIDVSVNKHSSDVVPTGNLNERDSSSTSPCTAKAVPLDKLADKVGFDHDLHFCLPCMAMYHGKRVPVHYNVAVRFT